MWIAALALAALMLGTAKLATPEHNPEHGSLLEGREQHWPWPDRPWYSIP
jgi:hypothetical protein